MSREKRLICAAAVMLAAAVFLLSLCVSLPWNTASVQVMASEVTKRVTRSQPALQADQAEGLINVNTADLETLQLLPGLGPAKAQRVIDEREANGPFYFPEDLKRVNGIGQKTVDKLRNLISF